jgi:hypothetical protein
VLGGVHAGMSLYWGLGGRWLLSTLGDRLVSQFAHLAWALVPLALLKAAGAVLPLWLDDRGWPARAWTRSSVWAGAAVLVAWGGANTVVGHLVLSGVIKPDGGYDHAGMVGHAWLWDPLFLLWGATLTAGMRATRPARRALPSTPAS